MTRLLRRLFLPLSLVLLVWAVLAVPLPLWAEAPGEVTGLVDHVVVEESADGGVSGDFLLTVVSVRPLTTAGVIQALADSDVGLVAEWRLITPGVERGTFFQRQREAFRLTAEMSAAIGLRAAGLPADPAAVEGDGAEIHHVEPGTPANGVLLPGDVITAIDDMPVTTVVDLRQRLAESTPDEAVQVRFLRDGHESAAAVVPRSLPGIEHPALGVVAETANARVPLPVGVTIESGRVGGTSAALLVALVVFDKVSPVDLAAGRVIAGTGTLQPDGRVGGVGSVRQKVIAASRAGADVFLVPAGQLSQAQQGLPRGSAMTVIPVASFDEALAALAAN